MNLKKKKRGFKLIMLSLLFLPIMQVLFIMGCNSDYLIKFPLLIVIGILIVLFVFLLLYGLKIFYQNKKASRRKLRKPIKVFLVIFMLLYIGGCTTLIILMYGPNEKFRNLYITTAMKTMHHHYLAQIFYTDQTIQEVLDSNYFVAIEEEANTDEIKINQEENNIVLNEYEKELLTKDEGNDLYKVLNITIGNSKAYLVAIYDPTKVKLIRTKAFNIGTTGERILTMCQRYGGVVCINAGGFEDQGWGSDIPTGYVIENGKVIWPSNGNGDEMRTSIIGLTADGKLKLMPNATANEAIASGVVDGLNFDPFLIVNGKSLEIVGDPWGKAPRVAIAQRKDGVMMFLVIDGENYINGASLKEMVETLERYGAYNAANLDGGQSSSLIINGSLYNVPPPAARAQGGRYVVTGFGLIP